MDTAPDIDSPGVKSPSLLPATLSLFASASTLICCALPALLVTLGLGAVMAGLIETVPQLVWLGAHKNWLFGIAAILIVAAGYWQWRARLLPCPTDPRLARACMRLRRVSWAIWWVSVAAFAIGLFFAYFAADLLL